MDRETRFQAEMDRINRGMAEGSIDENAAEALRGGAMAAYDQSGYNWWKLLAGLAGAVAVLIGALALVDLIVS